MLQILGRKTGFKPLALVLAAALAATLASCEHSNGAAPAPKSIEDQPAYLMAYFRSGPNQTDMTRKLHYAYSRDALHWYELNHNEAIWSTPVGAGIIRDPYIHKGPDGNYYLVHTTASPDNKRIGFAKTNDLITYSDARLLNVMDNFRQVGNAWAPEWTWDEAGKRYVVYWSSTINADKSGDSRIYKSYTTDWKTFTPAEILFDPGYNIIDANITPFNGKFYLFFKNGAVRPMRNQFAISDRLDGDYGQTSPLVTPNTTEAPEVLKLTGQQKWYLYYDYWAAGKYGVKESTDMIHWSEELPSNTYRFPYQRRHATFFPISEAELDRLIDHFSLLARYPMDQDDGGTVKDASPASQDAEVRGAKWSKSGVSGGALAFGGKNDGVKLGEGRGRTNKDSLAAETALRSVALWLKADSVKGTQVIYDEGGDQAGLAMRINDGELQATVAGGDRKLTVGAQISEGVWHHAAVVFNEGVLNLYVDGALKHSRIEVIKNIPPHPGDNGLGRRFGADAFGDNGDGDGFRGLLDEVSVYDIPLQNADVARLYANAGK